MSRRTFLLAPALCALLWGGGAAAQPASKLRDEPPPQALPDGGGHEERKGATVLSPEDREVVENLELLENFEQSGDLDLLVELSNEG